jgi:8-oxo-dGTP pyrophosphatase MutT (NUDIX family)
MTTRSLGSRSPSLVTLPALSRATLEGPLAGRLRADAAARLQVSEAHAVASAVLIGLFERDSDVYVWLLRRPERMRSHAGQVAFPGGKRDPEDADLAETALRESFEEIGLRRADVELVAPLDDLLTGTGFVITPFVGWVSPAFVPCPNPAEVARVFSVPLRLFAQRAAGVFPRMGHAHDGEFVWGATMAMARSLVAKVAVVVPSDAR